MTHPSGTMARTGQRSTLPADAAVLAIAVVWGASYPVTKGALAYAPVLVLIFYRFVATGCIMGLAARRELASARWGDILRAAVLGTILAAIFISEIAGLALTSATNAALIISLCTLFTPFLDHGLSRRLPPPIVVCGAVIACAGVGLLVGGLTAWTLGDGLILLAAALRAVMVVSTKRLMSARSLWSVALTAVQAATHSLRRTKASIIFKATGNLRAVQNRMASARVTAVIGLSPMTSIRCRTARVGGSRHLWTWASDIFNRLSSVAFSYSETRSDSRISGSSAVPIRAENSC
ncbi:hypothetical protein M673_04010 [Aureimonas sp. AU20]|uniref:DMT family transporter n=1 Tax=Aureimonas sp. AU20 TaxID=1349819 RepID=UPI000722F7FB|nr:DMT family transporter [Aureimonas sp. AU20]ALN71865.1 hypothetical protein M673_04010 [Aureimonas sp. AU20]